MSEPAPKNHRTLPFRGAEGLTLAASACGEPGLPPVLFVHGAGQTRHTWDAALDAFAGRGWYAVAIDLRGHGDSDWSPDGLYDVSTLGQDVCRVAAKLGNPVLVGASLGGMAALMAAGEHPDLAVRSIVLVDVTPTIEADGARRVVDFMSQGADGFASLEDVGDAVAGYLPHRRRRANLQSLHKKLRRRPDGRWRWRWDPSMLNSRRADDEGLAATAARVAAAASRVAIPIFLVYGALSDVVSAQGIAEVHAVLPQLEVAEVSGAGHIVAGEQNDRFLAAILRFLHHPGNEDLPPRAGLDLIDTK